MSAKIKMYSMPTCPHCHEAKAYLSKKGIDYEDIDVSKNKQAAKEMIDLSGSRSVPVLVINDEVIIGFDQNRIDAALTGQ
ncbi:MAG TPA: glutaredoxin family protein [Thermodesulfobacteriota bacterium]|mgnify:FL=1|nr:glutaredoxin family protein [Deltaproteobacteria bacterium]HNU70487.1 glutaredoxin family protein [Thermodesulfobacteriota bacterium]HOC39017.1 glutaredoxin family protein [Thermodesulfobacteriota bacterium]HQO76995.1 glutaredoxin family protein [Thermodesulfobacteriota bacterium]